MYDFRVTGFDRNCNVNLFSIQRNTHLTKSVRPELLIPDITSKENPPSPRKNKTKRNVPNVVEKNRAKIGARYSQNWQSCPHENDFENC